MSEIRITKANFDSEVLNAQKVVLVDFWATWCGPCKMLAPVLSEVAEKFGDKLTVGKVNVDEEQELAMQYRIASIPTLVIFKDGEALAKTVGYHTLAELEDWLKGQGVL